MIDGTWFLFIFLLVSEIDLTFRYEQQYIPSVLLRAVYKEFQEWKSRVTCLFVYGSKTNKRPKPNRSR